MISNQIHGLIQIIIKLTCKSRPHVTWFHITIFIDLNNNIDGVIKIKFNRVCLNLVIAPFSHERSAFSSMKIESIYYLKWTS